MTTKLRLCSFETPTQNTCTTQSNCTAGNRSCQYTDSADAQIPSRTPYQSGRTCGGLVHRDLCRAKSRKCRHLSEPRNPCPPAQCTTGTPWAQGSPSGRVSFGGDNDCERTALGGDCCCCCSGSRLHGASAERRTSIALAARSGCSAGLRVSGPRGSPATLCDRPGRPVGFGAPALGPVDRSPFGGDRD